MAIPQVDKSLARDRITSAQRRLSDFVALGDRIATLVQERVQLTQEFFFHAVGAIEMVAQIVNQARTLGKPTEMVSPYNVAGMLSASDPIKPLLTALCADPRKDPMPPDPYGDAGYVWRVWNYRHQVSHRGRTPFLFRVGSIPPVSLMLDPRYPKAGHATRSIQDELQVMLDIVRTRCEAILGYLP